MRKSNSSLPAPEEKRRWYYDACALESSEKVYREISNISHKHSTIALTSHLSLGEAFGNCLLKSKERKDPAILEAFWELITDLNNANLLYVVGHDDIEEQYHALRANIELKRIHIADVMHLATALKNQCQQLRTTDSDFLGMSKKPLRDVAEKYGIQDFSCTEVVT